MVWKPATPVSPAGIGASVWAALFGCATLYVAAGGAAGTPLIAESLHRQIVDRAPAIVCALWIYGLLKLALAAVPLLGPGVSGIPHHVILALTGLAGPVPDRTECAGERSSERSDRLPLRRVPPTLDRLRSSHGMAGVEPAAS